MSDLAALAAVWGAMLAVVPAVGVGLQGAGREGVSQVARPGGDAWRAAPGLTGQGGGAPGGAPGAGAPEAPPQAGAYG